MTSVNTDLSSGDCQCDNCRSACQKKPGWFLPGEAEKAAAMLGMTLPDFFAEKLMVDWYDGWTGIDVSEAGRDVFLLSPGVVGKDTGKEAPGNPNGRWIFSFDHQGVPRLTPIDDAAFVIPSAQLHKIVEAQDILQAFTQRYELGFSKYIADEFGKKK